MFRSFFSNVSSTYLQYVFVCKVESPASDHITNDFKLRVSLYEFTMQGCRLVFTTGLINLNGTVFLLILLALGSQFSPTCVFMILNSKILRRYSNVSRQG